DSAGRQAGGASPPRASGATSAQTLNASRDPRRFALLLIQLALLLVVFWACNIEGWSFLLLSLWGFGGFVVHYLSPFAWKKRVFIAISLTGGCVISAHNDAWMASLAYRYMGSLLLVGVAVSLGLVFFGCLRLKVPMHVRVLLLLGMLGLLFVARARGDVLPEYCWPLLGAIFMFRMMLYTYSVASSRQQETWTDFMAYFFCLPNFYFLLFPIIDYDKFKKGYFAEDIHRLAQRGISWMMRGTIHLCLFRLIYHRVVIGPDEVNSLFTWCQFIFPTYLLYLQVSGHFHIIVGMMHLFGFSLPETNHNYLLSSSFMDFWRRINIYWKDFMIKVFYYPTYFRLRKRGETLSLVAATVVVFISSCLLHSYQMFWLHGRFRLNFQDIVFWTLLGILVLTAVLWQQWRPAAKEQSRSMAIVSRVVGTLVVYVTISVIWSFWSSASAEQWWDAVTYWRQS
ncbi:MAG: hypothetical protein J3T61_11280, partial [Candidatus Brocadiales bacterium]|nr:hypothetical protein [Candidatus Bathyanammoxibius sp.]